jgi:phosphoketolase
MMTNDQQRHEQLLLQRTETNRTKLTGYFTQGKTANPNHSCVQKNCKHQTPDLVLQIVMHQSNIRQSQAACKLT